MLRVVLKDLRQRKLRLAATSLAILLGVAFMAGTLVLTDTVGRSFDDIFSSAYRGTDSYVRSDVKLEGPFGQPLRGKLPDAAVAQVAAVPGVARAVGTVQDYTQFVRPDGEALGNPRRGAPTLGGTWIDDPALTGFRLVEGRAPRAGADEVVIDRATARKAPFAVGDSATVLLRSGTARVTIVGIARFGTADSIGGASWALFSLPTAQRLLASPGKIDAVQVRAQPGYSEAQVVAAIEKAVPAHTEVLTGKQITKELQDQIRQGLGFFTTFLLIFGLVALLVGAFIIANTFSIIVAQRTRELALFRALGASRRQVLVSVVTEALVVGAVAAAAGLAAGVGLAIGLERLLHAIGLGLPNATVVVAPRTIAASVVVGVGVTVISALLPAWRASGVPPLAAMRDVAIDRSGASRMRAWGGLAVTTAGAGLAALGTAGRDTLQVGIGGGLALAGVVVAGPLLARTLGSAVGLPAQWLRGLTGRIARENTQRNPRRTAGSAAALMIGVIIVTIISVIAASATATVQSTISRAFTGDYVVQSNALGVPQQAVTDLRARPELSNVVAFEGTPAKLGNETIYLNATDTRALSAVVDLQPSVGSLASLGADGVAVSNRKTGFGSIIDAGGTHQMGETLTIQFVDGSKVPLVVRALYNDSTVAGRFIVDERAVAGHIANPVANPVLFNRAPGVSLVQARAAAVQVVKGYPGVTVQNAEEYSTSIANEVSGILNFIYVLLALAVIIALIGIANTLSLSITERTRELGLLRAVGMYRSQVRSTVRWEAVIVSVMGTVLGLALGLSVGIALVHTLADSGLRVLRIPTATIIAILGLAVVAGVVAAILPARRAARLDILAAIGTE